jgi:hypothetical protein
VLTLLMYLGTVKHLSQQLSESLQTGFSKEAQLRLKCVLQALMEHHSVLTPNLLATIMLAKWVDEWMQDGWKDE